VSGLARLRVALLSRSGFDSLHFSPQHRTFFLEQHHEVLNGKARVSCFDFLECLMQITLQRFAEPSFYAVRVVRSSLKTSTS
jgi:hypothetical protein